MDNLKTARGASGCGLRLSLPLSGVMAILCSFATSPAVADGGGLSLGLGGLGEVSIGRDGLADVDVDVGGLDVEAGVFERDTVAHGCVGNCDGAGGSLSLSVGGSSVGSTGADTGGGTTGTPATPRLGTAGLAEALPTSQSVPNPRRRAMACGGSGNSAVYNGYPVVDRSGAQIGVVHDTRLSQDLRISGLEMRSMRNRCVGLNGGTYRVSQDGRVWVEMDGSRFR